MAHLFKKAAYQNIPNKESILYECPEKTMASVHTLIVSNITGDRSVFCSVKIFDSKQKIKVDIIVKAMIEPGNTLVFDKPINLEVGDQILILPENIDELSAYASILEVV